MLVRRVSTRWTLKVWQIFTHPLTSIHHIFIRVILSFTDLGYFYKMLKIVANSYQMCHPKDYEQFQLTHTLDGQVVVSMLNKFKVVSCSCGCTWYCYTGWWQVVGWNAHEDRIYLEESWRTLKWYFIASCASISLL